MKVGFFAPVNYTNLCCTKISPCYAKYVVAYPKYLDYYRAKKETSKVYLDTVPSLPRQNNTELLLEAARRLEPDFIILPSKDYDHMRTVGLVHLFKYKGKAQLIGVLQGVSLDTLDQCYQGLKTLCSIIGLPSVLETISSRSTIVKELRITEPTVYIEIHANPYKELSSDKRAVMLTSYPIRLALADRRLEDYFPTPKPLDYELPKGQRGLDLTVTNIKDYLEVVK
jgi:hypothetical protein